MSAELVTARAALSDASARLTQAGVDSPRLDAELLLAEALGSSRERLFTEPGASVAADAARRFEELLERRLGREPLAYIVGHRHFRALDLSVDRRVLIPRPDTETLVEVALRELGRDAGARVHDVGTGSGAVALALKDERPDLVVSGSDSSPAAIEVARANARRLRLDVALSVARDLPAGRVDLVTANLPYVREGEWAGLAPEIRLYEPRSALVAGPDGLDAIRALIASSPPRTALALEHGPDQGGAVRALLAGARTASDLAGRERVTIGRVP